MLDQLFNPKSVAVIGASHEPGKLGYKILQNVVDGKFKGKIFPINPKGGEVLGLKCYPDVPSLPEAPELAVIVIPAKYVAESVRQCGEKGTKGLIVISAAFKEAGEEGKKREEELVAVTKKYGMRLIGPNCLGIMDTATNLNASFAFEMPLKGKMAFISQSGALGTAVLDWAMQEGVGFSKFISVGNMADVSECDLIEACGEDPDTKVILLYSEGIKDGRKFIEVARRVTKKKPIILVKSGVTSSGLKAVSSHTGSLAGSDRAFEAAFKQCGVLRASSVQELFDYALAFCYQPVIQGDRVAIVTNAGGPSVMAVDAIEKAGLKLAEISEATKKELQSFLPPAANTHNPVDALGDVLAKPYGRAMEIVIKDESVDGVVAILTPQVVTQPLESAQEVVRIAGAYRKPVVACFMGGKMMAPGSDHLVEKDIPNYPFPERAVTALRGLAAYRDWSRAKAGATKTFPVDGGRVKKILEGAVADNRDTLGDIEGRAVLDAYGIRTIQSFVAKDAGECVKAADKTGYPLVMKLVSPDILHKTEAGGVKVGIKNGEQARAAFGEIVASAKKYKPDATITGVQVQTQIEKATEVIIGVNKDPQFNHLLMFGLGGIFVEVLKDVSFRVIPVTDTDADEMLDEIKGARILKGFRNIPASDTDAVRDVLLRISQLCSDFPQIKEMDINPLMVFEKGKGALAVDVRIAL